MNCKLCGTHILATMQIVWGGYPYHADCIGEAIARKRAEDETEDWEIKQASDSFDEFSDVDDFDENFDDFEPGKESDKPQIIIPEIMAENNRREVHINDVVASATSQFVAERSNGNGDKGNVSTLSAGTKGSKFVQYADLQGLPLPEATDTFKPVPFYDFVTKLLDGLWDRRMTVHKDEYVISSDGLKLFGLIELVNEFNGVRFAVGLRSSNDKSMKLALAVGYRVICCSNGMLQGDYLPLSVKHTTKLELDDSLALGIDRIRRGFAGMQNAIAQKQEWQLEEASAREIIYRAFTQERFPISLFRTVHREYFVQPSYDEFKPKTLFSLENAFTTSFKRLQPVQQFEQTAKLGKFLNCLN